MIRLCKCGVEFEPTNPKIYQCKICKRAYDKAWRASRTPRSFREEKDRRLQFRYGISIDEYDRLLEEQEGKCAICGSQGTETKSGIRYALAVDHCHVSSSVRGLQHRNCSLGTGSLRDDVGLLERAIAYLQESVQIA